MQTDKLNFTPRPELAAIIAAEGNEWGGVLDGFDCRAERMNVDYLGCINGYIRIPEGHPWYGLGYDECDKLDPDVHGGITYNQEGLSTPSGNLPGWWLGFDTAHAGDLIPAQPADGSPDMSFQGDVYRDMDFVRSELSSLARQAKEVRDE